MGALTDTTSSKNAIDDVCLALVGVAGDFGEGADLLEGVEGPERDAAIVVIRERARSVARALDDLVMALG